ncbi:MAG: DNA-processing protein DprA [Armatimonadetes bacterium]|nr:DNA-processing protein DprA [Armatimonadota bacterium]
MTELPPATKLALLLTARWAVNDAKPLTNTEFLQFRRWLGTDAEAALSVITGEATLTECPLDTVRLKALLERGLGLFQPLDRWLQAGLWVRAWSDAEYPPRFKSLRVKAPALLFGCGNTEAFTELALAIVGSRSASEERLADAEAIGTACARDSVAVVSGGARGVDTVVMSACVDAGGSAVGVLADSLLKESGNRAYRRAIMESRLSLMSEVHPEARFEVGNAMSRNRLIHLCADATLLVECEVGKGGTWQGAMEALKESRTVYVLRGAKAEAQLVELGAITIDMDMATQPKKLITEKQPPNEMHRLLQHAKPATKNLSLFDSVESGLE